MIVLHSPHEDIDVVPRKRLKRALRLDLNYTELLDNGANVLVEDLSNLINVVNLLVQKALQDLHGAFGGGLDEVVAAVAARVATGAAWTQFTTLLM